MEWSEDLYKTIKIERRGMVETSIEGSLAMMLDPDVEPEDKRVKWAIKKLPEITGNNGGRGHDARIPAEMHGIRVSRDGYRGRHIGPDKQDRKDMGDRNRTERTETTEAKEHQIDVAIVAEPNKNMTKRQPWIVDKENDVTIRIYSKNIKTKDVALQVSLTGLNEQHGSILKAKDPSTLVNSIGFLKKEELVRYRQRQLPSSTLNQKRTYIMPNPTLTQGSSNQ
ncbi:hypothetical protein ILUMI_13898 [Ignelater luminosus]|uniref:Uncharacterized protein n=1 Tax=Ignelater luminosus TaxID=2038154 RepID=A0A8K0GAZ7_IGNLU|nr:hypothetical protein ILUMI_13898 [Ignelater luminosus]